MWSKYQGKLVYNFFRLHCLRYTGSYILGLQKTGALALICNFLFQDLELFFRDVSVCLAVYSKCSSWFFIILVACFIGAQLVS